MKMYIPCVSGKSSSGKRILKFRDCLLLNDQRQVFMGALLMFTFRSFCPPWVFGKRKNGLEECGAISSVFGCAGPAAEPGNGWVPRVALGKGVA